MLHMTTPFQVSVGAYLNPAMKLIDADQSIVCGRFTLISLLVSPVSSLAPSPSVITLVLAFLFKSFGVCLNTF